MNSHPPVQDKKGAKLHFTTAYQYYRYTEAKTAAQRQKFLGMFQKVLEERIPDDLEVEISDLQYKTDDRIFIELIGQRKADVQFCMNILKEFTGGTFEAHNVPQRQPLMGFIRKLGKVGFGIFVDTGIQNPYKEVLIPLHNLRDQLVGGEKLSTNEIVKMYGFIDNFPVEIIITKVEGQYSRKPKYEAKFSEKFLEQIAEWIEWDLDVVFSTGEPRQMVKRTIAKRGHTADVLEIQRLGPLEVAAVCNHGTNGPGLIAHIGKFLPHCRLSTLIPAKVKKYW